MFDVTYAFTVSNTGDVTLSNVTITDPMTGLTALTYTRPDATKPGVLAPGQSATATATYQLTATDAANRTLTNTATATSDQAPPVHDSVTLQGPPPTPIAPVQDGMSALAAAGGTISPLLAAIGVILFAGGLLTVLLMRKRRARSE